MNAILSRDYPLPAVLVQAAPTGPCRRHRIAGHDLSPSRVADFNGLLASLGGPQPPLDRDRLATAARQLRDREAGGPAPRGIARELRRGVAVTHMVADPGWIPAQEAADVAIQVVDYLQDHDDLIPDTLPGVGRLDDAIVIEAAWPRLVNEIASYLDFRRIRRIEAMLRGVAERAFRFTRDDWQQARLAECALAAQRRSVREARYVPAAQPLFRVY